MCGIFGIVSFDDKILNNKKDFFYQALITNSLRGMHGTGICTVSKENNVEVYKKAMSGYDFTHLPRTTFLLNDFKSLKYAIGHNRHATKGDLSDINSHPFIEDNITLVHNGNILWMHTLDVPNAYQDYNVDSHILTKAFALHGYKATIPRIEGAAALAWFDSSAGTFHLYRNKERPMYFSAVKNSDTIIFGSELKMINWLAERNGIEVKKSFYLEDDMVITFKDSIKYTKELIKPNPKQPTPVYNWNNKPIPAIEHIASNQRLTSNSKLGDYNLKIGQLIEFAFEEMCYNNHKSRHGDLIGRILIPPYPAVIARGIKRDEFKGDYVLEGRVLHAEYDPKYKCIMVHLGAVKQTNQADTGQALVYEDGPGADDNDGETVTTYVAGPLGHLITIDQFKLWVKDGCVNCSTEITEDMIHALRWTHGNQPVCYACQTNPAITPYLH